jgi:pilus assembly protein Flp/PilA
MKNLVLKAYVWMQIWRDQEGQDLIEYSLVAALIAFAAVAGMSGLATKINGAFSTIGSKLTSSLA